MQATGDGVHFTSNGTAMTLHVVREPDDERLGSVVDSGDDLRATVTLQAGQVRGTILETGSAGHPRRVSPAEVERMFDDTAAFWKSWLAQSTYTGRWREALERVAITLKLMTYAPTGGIVAAPTMGLPGAGRRRAQLGLPLRVGAGLLVLSYALSRHGLHARSGNSGIASRCPCLRNHVQPGDSAPLHVLYRIDGSSDLKEEVLEHWEGYRGSGPARVGDGAADQLQLDIYGEAIDRVHLVDQLALQGHGHSRRRRMGPHRGTSSTGCAEHWDQPEEGIWETRSGRRASRTSR